MPRPEPRPTNPFPLLREPVTGDVPLSVGQERLWWLHQMDSSSNQYHICGGWQFPKEVDAGAIRVALDGLVRRHEVLRTGFVLRSDGTIVQQVADEVEVPVTWAGREWSDAVEQAAVEPFDLSRPPLLRAVAAQLDDEHGGLFLALHHIVTDRWSMDVLARDLFELYAAALAGLAAELPELPVQYGDYARWQRRFLDEGLLESQLEYWKQALAGYERLELPVDRARSTGPDPVGRTVTVEMSPEATETLTAMAWRTRASPAMVVAAALTTTLSMFTGQSDVVVGAIVSDRPHPELQDLVGFFINTVVLRIDLDSPALTFREAVVRTRDAWMAADAHQDAPFEQIVGAVNAGSGDGRNPIFDIAVNHAGDRVSLSALENAPTWWYPKLPVTARFDLSLTTQIVDGRLRSTFVYRPSLFDETSMAALAARYSRVLEQGVAQPKQPLAELDLLDETELKLLHSHNDMRAAPDATIVARVQAQAATRPDAPAVVGADGRLTYRALNERANQLARHLLNFDVCPEDVVAVALERTVDRFVVLLAIAKCGAAYFPVDLGFPADRLRFLLADAGAVLTVVSPSLRDRVPPTSVPVLVRGAGDPDLSGYDHRNLPSAARPDNLAYLISTSGSTGTPKAVDISHRGLSRLVAGAPRYLDVGPGTTFMQAGPLTFDVAVLEWIPLAHGGQVVVTETDPLLEDLPDILRRYQVTTLKLVSPQLDLLVERDIRVISGLRRLIVGGDVVNPRSFAAARELLPDCRVTASYGPTESTVWATVFDELSWSGRVPIGTAVPHTRVYVLDQNLRPTSIGMRGEIYLAGDGLARGYHGRPSLTAQAFLPDPFGPPGARMYRTGDHGRYLAGGVVDFLGRADHQVKIRGYRIETSEVEHALLRHRDITSAVVLRETLGTGPALVAYIVTAAAVEGAQLRRDLRDTLPVYMIPDHIVEIGQLPLTAHNKVDRTALPSIAEGRLRSPGQPAATESPAVAQDVTGPPVTGPPVVRSRAATGLEGRIAEAWSAVLGRAVPETGDFFDHGGHSLLVPPATAVIRRLLGREVPLRLMLQHRTPVSYAAALLRESVADLGAVASEHRLEQQRWFSPTLGGDRRVDLFVTGESPHGPSPDLQTMVVLDGSEFVDIMRLPSILDHLVQEGRAPMTAAVFLSPLDWAARSEELLCDRIVDVLADELLPHLHLWVQGRSVPRATVVGASLGAVAALRATLRRPDRFAGAVALSGPLSEHQLDLAAPGPSGAARVFLSAGREEAEIRLDGGVSLLDANRRTGEELRALGHTVRYRQFEGGHTYASWEGILPQAISWAMTAPSEQG